MKLKAVVIRHLENSRPVASAVIEEPIGGDIDDIEHYLMDKGEEYAKTFIQKFPEFRAAKWYIDVIDENNNFIVATEIIFIVPVSRQE